MHRIFGKRDRILNLDRHGVHADRHSETRASSSPATASRCALCSPTTAAATAPTCSDMPVVNSRSATTAPNPTRHKPTAKQNASSRPPSENGPTPNTGPIRRNATPISSPGPITTTTNDLMVASTTIRPSAAPIAEQPLDHLQAPAFCAPTESTPACRPA